MTDLARHHAIASPSPWVRRFAPLIGAGEVLDLACGSGRHAKWLAGLGHRVLALDKDESALALAAGQGINTMQADLEKEELPWPFEAGRFAAIVVTNYLHRPLFPHIVASLAQDGVLIYETFAAGNEQFGKPSNPNFLLQSGELLQWCAGLRIVAYEDGYVDQPKPAMVQRICAVRPDRPTLPERLRLS
jgi:SAM-dependent methyltransferase